MSARSEQKPFLLIGTILWIGGMSCSVATAHALPDGKAVPQKAAAQNDESGRANEQDPFADLDQGVTAQESASSQPLSWSETFFKENLGFRKEIMSQFDINQDGHGASRQSVGFEVLKKFSTATSTVASFDFQGRFVRRDGFNPVLNDMEGESRRGWAFEYHNLYLDLYNVLNPVLSDSNGVRVSDVSTFGRAGSMFPSG